MTMSEVVMSGLKEDFLRNFNEKFRRMYAKYNEAVNRRDYDEAIKLGKDMLNDLLAIARKYILENLNNPTIRSLVEDILTYHEKNLGYVEGTEEAIEDIPLLFTFEAKERILSTLAPSIQELFSFILGALLVLADIRSTTFYRRKENTNKDKLPKIV